jgi:hypothetical protein
MKIDCSVVLFLYLFFLAIFVIKYLLAIDGIFGGFTDCLICTKVRFNGYLTNWTISHYFAFLIAGYICPKNVYFIIFAGILWEFVELFLEYNSKINHEHILCTSKLIECETKMSTHEFWEHYLGIKEHNTTYVWCSGGMVGSLIDIVINTFGVYTGIYIHKLLNK